MAAQSSAKKVELDDLQEQFEALRAEMKEMSALITEGLGERADMAKGKAAETAAEMASDAKDKVTQLHADAEKAISANPLAAIAIFAGVGFLLGAVTRR